jgi:hypothetical protein
VKTGTSQTLLDGSLRLGKFAFYFFCAEHRKNLMMLGVGTDLRSLTD